MERGHHIDIRNVAYFHHVYDSEQPDMRRLYEQAKIDQWNAATDIDWEPPLEGDGGLTADDLVYIHGTKSGTACPKRSASSSTAASAGGASRP